MPVSYSVNKRAGFVSRLHLTELSVFPGALTGHLRAVALVLACLLVGLAPIQLHAQNVTLVPYIVTVAGNGTHGYGGFNQTARVVSPISSSQADPKAQAKILDVYGNLPLNFEANHGQTDGRVKFLSRTGGYTLFLTGDEAVLAFSGKKADPHKAKIASDSSRSGMAATRAVGVLRMKLRNANPTAKVTGTDELAGTSNYFIGNDPAKWRTNVPTYAKVKYEGIYSGIDLIYYGNQRQLEYDFIVGPGADPHRIQFDVRGAKRIRRDEHGDLVLRMGEDEIRWHKPVVYQVKNGTRQEISARYAITETNRVGFEIAGYDASRRLYIDPLLIYSTYLGGSGQDNGVGIAVDSSGNAYVTGQTYSTDFPTMNPLQPANAGGGSYLNLFVAKINSTGSALVYSTYLGGSGGDQVFGIAVDSSGNAYVTGLTASTNFPTKNPLQPANAGGWDAFVAKLNPTGTALVYSTYLGGSGSDEGNGIAVDSLGNAYVTGFAGSTNFPTTSGCLQPAKAGGDWDAFVTKLDSVGSLVYSTYLGGSDQDNGNGIAVDSSGNAYVIGSTGSSDFPTTSGAFQTVCNAGNNCGTYNDAFVAKLNPTGTALRYSTYLGGSLQDSGVGIAVDSSGNAYVIGSTGSSDFPTTSGAFQTVCNAGNNCGTYNDAFVAKINSAGSGLVYSTYLGGSGGDGGRGIAVDSLGNAYVTGVTFSTNFPTMNPLQPANASSSDAFVAEINPSGSALVYSTYLGGSGQDNGNAIAVDSAGNAYVTGVTNSANFPTTAGAFQTVCNGGNNCATYGDAFVAKIALLSSVTTIASSSNPSAFGQSVTFTATVTPQGSDTPTGTVTFTYGSTTLCNAMTLSGGTATCAYSDLPVGSDTVTATYSGDANFTPSSGSVSQTVTGTPQTISFPNPGPQTYGVAPLTLTATATSGLPVSYAVLSGPATVNGSTLTITGTGSVTVQATQAGNNAWLAATPVSVTFTVNPAVLTVTANNMAMSYVAQVAPTFTASYSGFVNGDTSTVLTGAPAFSPVTLPLSAGSYPIGVSQGTLSAANYTFTFVPAILTITPGATPTLTFLNNYFVTGDHIVRSFDPVEPIYENGMVIETVTIPGSNNPQIEGVPDGADIVAAFLYWQALETSPSPSSANALFHGYPVIGDVVGTDLQSSCWAGSGSTPFMRAYRADVLPYLPVVGGASQAVGSHPVGVPANLYGSVPGNASLVIIYRMLSKLYPLKATVIYDGNWSLEYAAGNPLLLNQTISGFYEADASGSAKITDIFGTVVNNGAVSFSPATSTGYTRPQTLTPDASGIIMPNHYALQSGQCNVWAAVVFSTTVKNSDGDGLLDAWKAGPAAPDNNAGKPGYYDVRDNSWVDLSGAKLGQKDLFVQLDYMVGTDGHSHQPSPDALSMVQNTFLKHNINVHFVNGNAITEDICSDDTSTSPPNLCMFPGEPGVVAWKTGLEVMKAWPVPPAGQDLTSCIYPASCSSRFQPGRKDSYHYVLFGHSLALPTWSTLANTLVSIEVAGGSATVTTSAPINPCPTRITIDGALTNPNMNGVYSVTGCQGASLSLSGVSVSSWTYPNTLPEPQLAIYLSTTDTTSGYSDVGGGDAAVTLGKWQTPQTQTQLVNEQAGTVMHELGHDLGLTHGGRYYPNGSTVPGYEPNCKPNYQSVMSYLFQVDLLQSDSLGHLALDYSGQSLNTLDENNLGQSQGLTGAAYPYTKWYSPSSSVSGSKPASTHCDGTPPGSGEQPMYETEGAASPIVWSNVQDINFDGAYSLLDGYSDWDNIDLHQIGASGNDNINGLIYSIHSQYQLPLGADLFSGGGGIRASGGGGGIRASGGGGGIRASGGGGGIRASGGGGGIRASGGGGGIRASGGGGGMVEATYQTIDSYARPPRAITEQSGVIRWLPPTFGNILGFNVYSNANGSVSLISPSPIPYDPSATSYTFTDTSWKQGSNVTYYVTTVDLDPTNSPRESTPAIKGDQATLTVNAPTTLTYDVGQTLSAGGGSGQGTVTFNLVSGPCTLSSAELTANTGTGSCVVTATKAGDNIYNPVTSAAVTIGLVPATTTTTISCPTSVIYNGTAQTPCSAVVTGIGGLNESAGVAYTNNINVGTATASASFAGNANYYPSTAQSVTFTINQSLTTTVLSVVPNPVNFGQSVSLTATVAPVAPGGGTPRGTVTFKDGSTSLATVPLSNSAATFTTSSLAAGAHNLNATYNGDTNFKSSSTAALSEQVVCGVLLGVSPSTVRQGGTITVTGQVISCVTTAQTVTVKFSLSGPLQPNKCGSTKSDIFTTPPFTLPAKTSKIVSFPLTIPRGACTGTYSITTTTLVKGTAVNSSTASLTITAH